MTYRTLAEINCAALEIVLSVKELFPVRDLPKWAVKENTGNGTI